VNDLSRSRLTAVRSDSVAIVAGGLHDSSLTRIRPFFETLIARDPAGESWLPDLLKAAHHGEEILGDVLSAPGTLESALTTKDRNGLLRCFEFGVGAPKELLRWYVRHPEKLVWPHAKTYSDETVRMRRALLSTHDGIRADAQRQALDYIDAKSPKTRGWWRFEGTSMIDCVLMTPQVVVTIEGKRTESLSAATDWYPERSQLVRNLEAAKQLANERTWATLLLSEVLVPEGSDAGLNATLPASAPHLDDSGRDELRAHYLGNLTWQEACQATGVRFESLPRTTGEL
jgi:hypothetical protein